MPDNNENPDTEGFTGVTDTNGPGTSAMNSFISSLQSEFTQTTRTGTRASTTTDASATVTGTGGASVSAVGTTLATVTTGAGNSGTASISGNASSTAGNAASNTSDGAVTVSEGSCNSISCSSTLKAAVAVPIVVAAIAAVFLFLFCARRRRKRRAAGASVSEKKPKKTGKKWSRHLRAFSFDAELLMGGRFSSSNSIRSRDPSVRSANNSRNGAHSTEPSLHSIDEVAPPYRDAIAGSHPLNPSPLRHVNPAIASAPDPIPRSVSSATAPPPYQPAGRDADHPATPTSNRNPFADSTPVSPIDGSPFNDPPDDEEAGGGGAVRPMLSRGSSLYQSVNADDASDVASIGQAQVGRSVSVRQVDSSSGSQ